MKYFILHEPKIDKIEAKVNDCMEGGAKPIGNVSFDGKEFLQAMILEDPANQSS